MANQGFSLRAKRASLLKDFGYIESNTKSLGADAKVEDSFPVNARALKIDSGHISQYWQWTTREGIEEANAVNLRHLGVHGAFDTIVLTYGVPYKVSFLLRTSSTGNMAGQQVTLALALPNGRNQVKQAYLPNPSEVWQELEVGQFTMASELTGEIKFSMEQDFQDWMRGLTIKGVKIRRK